MRYIVFAALSAAAAASLWASSPEISIYTGDRRTDTVTVARQFLVGATTPDAAVTIDGRRVSVNAAGSFGTEVMLQPGETLFNICAVADSDTAQCTVRYFYAPQPDGATPAPDFTPQPLAKPLTVVTRPGAYLQHSAGTDRLGASKMGYLAEGISLTAFAASPDLYQVYLTTNETAYIPRDLVVDTLEYDAVNTVATGSISVTNAGNCDRITVKLPARVPYYCRTLLEPSTLLVTLYGVVNNSNWITQLANTGMIDYVDLRREGDETLTLAVRLRERYQWGYSVGYDGTNMVIDVRHRPRSLHIKDLTVGLDAGHGGQYLGAVSPSGLCEKDVNLDIVLKAAEMLTDMGARVVLTREGDTGPSMDERRRTWLDGKVDIAVSVHNNASGDPLASPGTSCYFKHMSNMPLARSLHSSLLGLGFNDFGLTGNFNFSLNQPTEYPNALVEALFMSSIVEEEILSVPDERTRIARAIVDGLLNYLDDVKASLK